MTINSRMLRATISTTLAAVGLLVLIVTLTPVVSWWARALAGPWTDPSGQVLVVLGGSILDDGTIGQSSYWRSVYAALEFRRGQYASVVLSGGGDDRTPVAEAMRTFLQCSGVPPGVIHVEARSRNTRENALFVKPILDRQPGTKVLMTSDYHMFRAVRTFRKIGIAVAPHPIPDAIKRSVVPEGRWGAFIDVATETAVIVYYFAAGWI
jgi:uncharacterized SAM-binding protein YcdF (DUF218 family)